MFTRKELDLFNDTYFKVIRREEQFVELQSINTGHCWNIFKNQFEEHNKITLYHKNAQTNKYYHRYSQCCTVADAIVKIKNYDTYVIEQKIIKEKTKSTSKKYPDRHLKVHATSGYKNKMTPTIILKGEWLKEWGFDPGSRISVSCLDGTGKLIVSVVK